MYRKPILFRASLVVATVLLSTMCLFAQNQLGTGSNQNPTTGTIGSNLTTNAIDSIGNVGIGTNNPTHKLEVVGSSKFSGTVEVDSASVFNDSIVMMSSRVEEDLIVEGDLIMRKYRNEAYPTPRPVFITSEGLMLSMDVLQDIYGNQCPTPYYPLWMQQPDKTYVYCVERDIRVGINTDDPQYALDVVGNQFLSGRLGIGIHNPTQKLEVQGNQYLSGKLGIGITMPDHELEVDGDQYLSGKLGINKETPEFPLDIMVYNTTQEKIANFVDNTNNLNQMFFVPRLDGENYNNISLDNDFGLFWSDHLNSTDNNWNDDAGLVIAPWRNDANSKGIRISGDGKVGIGTNTPENRLDVEGSQYISGNLGIGTSSPGKKLEIQNGALKLSGGCGTDGDTRFLINIDGSSSDSFFQFYKGTELQFYAMNDGTFKAKRIEVEATIVPDFVFEKEYELLPLVDLETHINKHKHLPGIPDEKSIKSDGLDVGQMQMLLLQKVEELTLYTIEQQKQIEELKKEVENLRNQ